MKHDDKWLDALRKNLDGYEVKPSGELWKRVECDLTVSRQKPAIVVPLWLKLSAAAAAVAFVAGGGWMYLSRVSGPVQQESLAGNRSSETGLHEETGKLLSSIRHSAGYSPAEEAAASGAGQASARYTASSMTTDKAVVTTDSTDSEVETVAPVLAAAVSATDAGAQDRGDDVENREDKKKQRARSGDVPRNWYDAMPEGERKAMAELAADAGKQRWSIAFTAMNGLPSAGGSTGSPAVPLSAMSEAPSGLRPFGGSLGKEFADNRQPVLLEQPGKQESVTSVKHKIPVSYGASFRYNVTEKWGLESGLSYTLLSSTFSNDGSHSSYDQNLGYIELPVRVSYMLVNRRWYAVYAAAGGAAAKCVSARIKGDNNEDYNIDEKPWQFSVSTAAGVQLNVLEHIGIYLEPGVGYYFKDNSGLRTVYKDHPWSFKLNMGFRISY